MRGTLKDREGKTRQEPVDDSKQGRKGGKRRGETRTFMDMGQNRCWGKHRKGTAKMRGQEKRKKTMLEGHEVSGR